MRHHFVSRGGCHRRSRLGKSAIAAPTLEGIAVIRAQRLTLARVHLEIRRNSCSHLAVMHALGVPSLVMCPRDPSSQCRNRSHLTVLRTLRGRCRVHLREMLPRSCPPRSTFLAAATSPSCAPHGATATCVPSGSDATAAPISTSCASQGAIAARWPRGSTAASVSPGSAVTSLYPDPSSCACSQDPPSRASRGAGVTVSVAKTEP
jgi:hypothetical protein